MRKSINNDRSQRDPEMTLDEVLEAYVMSERGPSREVLVQWLQRYPRYKEELVAFTARWSLATHLPDIQAEDEVDEATLIRRGMSVVYSILHAANQARALEGEHPLPPPAAERTPAELQSPVSPGLTQTSPKAQGKPDAFVGAQARLSAPIQGLMAEGARLGLTADALADKSGLSVSLLAKLERRVILADSIPHVVNESVARAIERSPSAVIAYSRMKPSFARGAEHRSEKAPVLPHELESFFDAVRSDPELTDDQRAALLALESKSER